MAYSLGSKFVDVIFSFINHTENCSFVGTGIRGIVYEQSHSDFTRKLWMIGRGTIFILGHEVKGQGHIPHCEGMPRFCVALVAHCHYV